MGIFKKKHAGTLNVVLNEYEKSQLEHEPCEDVIPGKHSATRNLYFQKGTLCKRLPEQETVPQYPIYV